MKSIVSFGLIVVSLLIGGLAYSQIPANRTINWSRAGVEGGIPNYSTTKNFLNNGGKANDPNFDNSVPLKNLLGNVAGSKTVIYFPAGTYRFKDFVTIPIQGNVIIRGDGAEKTIFEFETGTTNTGNFTVWGQEIGSSINVTGGHTFKSKTITLANTTGLKAGDYLDISQENDSAAMWTDRPTNALQVGPRSAGQILKIKSISGNTVTLDRPLHMTYKAVLKPQVKKLRMAPGIGFENFTMKSITAGRKHHFLLMYTANSWIKCVKSIKSEITHVNPNYCSNIEIRDSYFHDSFEFGQGGNGGGVAISMHSTYILVENNIFDRLRHAMLVQRGANGCVFGYNFSQNATTDGSYSKFSRIPDGSLHGHWPYMNLYEGNVLEHIHSADYWGPSGHGNTFFRNRLTREGIIISEASVEQNIVGNDMDTMHNPLFVPNTVQVEPEAIRTMVHGNKENGQVNWDPTYGSNNVNDSYYLSSKPTFYAGFPWPNIGPEYTDAVNPAFERWVKSEFTYCDASAPAPYSDADYISNSFPVQMTTGEKKTVTVRMKNTGTKDWVQGQTNGFKLGMEQTLSYKWNANRVALPQAKITPTNAITFTFDITAPAQAGKYDIQMQMVQESVEWFGEKTPVVTIDVVDPPYNDSKVTHHFIEKTLMDTSELFKYDITFVNTGTTTWKPGDYFLGTLSPMNNSTWGASQAGMGKDITPGDSMVYKFTLRSPDAAGKYFLHTQLREGAAGWFGETTPKTEITVSIMTGLENFKESQVSIYPNPGNKDIINIISEDHLIDKVEVYQSTGALLLSKRYGSEKCIISEPLPAGVYFIKVYGKGVSTFRFVKL